MSKKNKRQIRSVALSESKTESKTISPAGSSSRPARDEFNPDYTHVLKDLRRIGVLAGSFLVVLIGLSFLIPLLTR